jgi:hypothetical protein
LLGPKGAIGENADDCGSQRNRNPGRFVRRRVARKLGNFRPQRERGGPRFRPMDAGLLHRGFRFRHRRRGARRDGRE